VSVDEVVVPLRASEEPAAHDHPVLPCSVGEACLIGLFERVQGRHVPFVQVLVDNEPERPCCPGLDAERLLSVEDGESMACWARAGSPKLVAAHREISLADRVERIVTVREAFGAPGSATKSRDWPRQGSDARS
jgi:hypothetical protein